MTRLSVLDQSPVRSGAVPADAIRETLALARRCDELGYTRYWLAEHHSTPALAGSAPEVLIGQVAAVTSGIRVGSGGVMLQHYSALKVAEAFRVLETLYPGRIDLGIGRAPGSDQLTARALGGSGAPEFFPQQVQDLLAFVHGELPPEQPYAKVRAMPTGPTAPELWLLGSSEQSAAIAAHFGAAFSFAHFINADGGAEITRAYAREFKPSAWLATPQASVAVFIVCAETHDEAERLAKSRDLFVARLYTGRGGRYPTVAEAEAHEYTPWERQIVEHARGRRVAGTPAECRERAEGLGRDHRIDEDGVGEVTRSAPAQRRTP